MDKFRKDTPPVAPATRLTGQYLSDLKRQRLPDQAGLASRDCFSILGADTPSN